MAIALVEGSWAYKWAVSKGYISQDRISLENMEIGYGCGKISMREGAMYWENIPGYWRNTWIQGVEASGEWTMRSDDEWILIELR